MNPTDTYKEKIRKIKRRYNVSAEFVTNLLDKQKGCCAICSKDFGSTGYHIDHCHSTLEVRGLLCSNCNTGIGLLQEDEIVLNKAIDYLKR